MAYDFQTGISGGLSGAATGFSVGGPVGAGIGGVVGLASGFGKKKKKKTSTLDKNQKKLYGDINSSLYGEGPFNDLYQYDVDSANKNFDMNIARPEYRNFQENVIPKITGQFRSQGIGNSSYTGEALARSGRDLEETLAGKRSDMVFKGQQEALNRKERGIQGVMGTNTQAIDTANKPSLFDDVWKTLGPAAGEYIADYMKKSGPSTQSGGKGGGIGYSMDIMNQFTGGMR